MDIGQLSPANNRALYYVQKHAAVIFSVTGSGESLSIDRYHILHGICIYIAQNCIICAKCINWKLVQIFWIVVCILFIYSPGRLCKIELPWDRDKIFFTLYIVKMPFSNSTS